MSESNLTNVLFILMCAAFMIVLFLSMNHIRRRYFVTPILELRAIVGISGPMAEITILPIMKSIAPLLIRLQGATHRLDFSFNLGASLGSMFNSIGFSVGISALILGYSSQIEMSNFLMHSAFLLAAIGFYFFICNNESVGLVDSIVSIAAWFMFVVIRWLQ